MRLAQKRAKTSFIHEARRRARAALAEAFHAVAQGYSRGMQNLPFLLIILDGLAHNPNPKGNAVFHARKPNLDRLFASSPSTELVTFGERVGLPDDQMGNSEVGHLNIGGGRVVEQELTRINR